MLRTKKRHFSEKKAPAGMQSRNKVIFHQKKAPAGMQSRNQVIFQQKKMIFPKSVHIVFTIFPIYFTFGARGWTPLPWNSYYQTNAKRPYIYIYIHKALRGPLKGHGSRCTTSLWL